MSECTRSQEHTSAVGRRMSVEWQGSICAHSCSSFASVDVSAARTWVAYSPVSKALAKRAREHFALSKTAGSLSSMTTVLHCSARRHGRRRVIAHAQRTIHLRVRVVTADATPHHIATFHHSHTHARAHLIGPNVPYGIARHGGSYTNSHKCRNGIPFVSTVLVAAVEDSNVWRWAHLLGGPLAPAPPVVVVVAEHFAAASARRN